MKQYILVCVVLVLGVFCIGAQNTEVATKSLVFEDQFDTLEVGTQPGGYLFAEETGSVVVQQLTNNDHALFLEDLGKKNTRVTKEFEPQNGTISFVMDFMQPNYGSTTKVVRLMNRNSSAGVHIETRSGGVLAYKVADGSFVPLLNYEKDRWYTLQIDADIQRQRANLFVNGILLAEETPFYQEIASISIFDSYTPGSGVKSHYIDNVQLYDQKMPPVVSEKAMAGIVALLPESAEPAPSDSLAESTATPVIVVTETDKPETADPEDSALPITTASLALQINDLAQQVTLLSEQITLLAQEITELEATQHQSALFDTYDTTYEAEEATFEGVIVDTKHAGYTGNGFTDYNPNAPGGYIEWIVTVPVAAEYALQFRYAHGGSDERPAEIQVNQEVAEASLSFDPTGAWNTWLTTTTIVALEQGDNVIRATAIGPSGGGNIDHLKVLNPALLETAQEETEMVIQEVSLETLINPMLAKQLDAMGFLTSQEVTLSPLESEFVSIASVQAVTDTLVLITLDGYLETVDPYDIMVSVATNPWESLNPNFVPVDAARMAMGHNALGNTVLVYELTQKLNAKGGYPVAHQTTFTGDVAQATERARNMISMQLDSGGWYKNNPSAYETPWDGTASRSGWINQDGVELATIDNDATITEITYIAEVYTAQPLPEFQASIEAGIDFLLQLQYESGGFAQVYPQRGTEEKPSYSDFVTYNDNAMINVLNLFDTILERNYPFSTIGLDESYYTKIAEAKAVAIEYILQSQIEVDGVLTAWCAQHDPYTYEPQYARSYEHPSISGMESVAIVTYLMGLKQTDAITQAVESALAWFDQAKVSDMRYASADPKNIYFYEAPGSDMWYRFYEIGTNQPIFSGRDGVIQHDILQIEAERRNGYSWAGNYASKLLQVTESIGFYEDCIYAEVVQTQSASTDGKTLQLGDMCASENLLPILQEQATVITVSQEGIADFPTVQAAIDWVPEGNVLPVEIHIAPGVYKEVITIPAGKPFITLIGSGQDKTILTYDNYAGKDNGRGGTMGTSGSASVYIYANDFRARHITFENSFDKNSYQGSGTQAVAVYARGARQSFFNCSFLGQQDTLYAHSGTQYFYNCYIEGDVDFIFGASTAVFEQCEIHSLDRGSLTNNGYITAASTNVHNEYGFLFVQCNLTSNAPVGTVYLGRPWHPSGDPNAIASVVFRECTLGAHIHPEGWTSMSGFEPEGHRFFEYANSGSGAGLSDRRGERLDQMSQGNYTIEKVLAGWQL